MLKVGSIDTCSFVVGQNWYYIRKDIIWEFFLLLKCRKTKWLRLQSLARKRSTFFICILSFFVKLSERPNADFSCFLAFINYHTFPFLMFWSWTLVYLFLANMHIDIDEENFYLEIELVYHHHSSWVSQFEGSPGYKTKKINGFTHYRIWRLVF